MERLTKDVVQSWTYTQLLDHWYSLNDEENLEVIKEELISRGYILQGRTWVHRRRRTRSR